VGKNKFHHFGSPLGKVLENLLVAPPWKKSFRRPCLHRYSISKLTWYLPGMKSAKLSEVAEKTLKYCVLLLSYATHPRRNTKIGTFVQYFFKICFVFQRKKKDTRDSTKQALASRQTSEESSCLSLLSNFFDDSNLHIYTMHCSLFHRETSFVFLHRFSVLQKRRKNLPTEY